jgi:hypothetical protein
LTKRFARILQLSASRSRATLARLAQLVEAREG